MLNQFHMGRYLIKVETSQTRKSNFRKDETVSFGHRVVNHYQAVGLFVKRICVKKH